MTSAATSPAPAALLSERQRFLDLFDALVVANNAWMTGTPQEKWDWVPFENPNMKFGDRISTITIRSVFIHTIVGETQWANLLPQAGDGEMRMDPQTGKALTQQLNDSADLIGAAMALHGKNLDAYASLPAEHLARPMRWSGRDWTVMGFLWGIYAHRAYHLGNIDIFMREADEAAPDFFSNFRQQMA